MPQLVDDQIPGSQNNVGTNGIGTHAMRSLKNPNKYVLPQIFDLGRITPVARNQFFNQWPQWKHFLGEPQLQTAGIGQIFLNEQTLYPSPRRLQTQNALKRATCLTLT